MVPKPFRQAQYLLHDCKTDLHNACNKQNRCHEARLSRGLDNASGMTGVQMLGFMENLLVDKAIGEGVEELIGGVVLHQHPLAHGQRLCCRGRHHITLAGVDEDLSSTQPWSQHTLHATMDACIHSGCVFHVLL